MTPTEQPKQPKRPLSEAPLRGAKYNQKALQAEGVFVAKAPHPIYEGLFYWGKRSCGSQRWVTEEAFEKVRAQEREWAASPKGRAIRNSHKATRRKTLNNNMALSGETLEAVRDVYHVRDDLTLAARSVGSSECFHVDHIMPLRPAVMKFNGTWQRPYTGLHAAWNLQILEASENLSKSNSTPEQL